MNTMLRALLLCLLPLVTAPVVAEADVLVMVDGSRITTSGEFETRGRQVRFTDASGRLMMVRASEVDFPATEAANRPAPAVAAVAAPEAPVKPVMVLTDADIREGTDAPAEAEEPQGFTVYVTDWCGYCRKTERLLDELGVPYETIDVEKVPGARAEKSRYEPNCGVPVTVLADQSICGYSESAIRGMAEDLPKPSAEPAPADGEESFEEGETFEDEGTLDEEEA